ncbi:probable lipid-A-disaccharide synthase, mitochondrial isoform X2 [Magnolia sinica]|nr:probable lipid-A-disaccharide synthase, mitochondrial isoform X2 [Magnolia sinica]XP_058114970.1 probable lipid-A-disaccharide synthase, mitochondrial isoform X2 [Magnolia sinica]
MSKEGLQSLYPMEDISVMGFWEVFPHIRKIRMRLKETIEAAILFRPHVVVTIDSKAFSFRFLKQLRDRCIEQGLASPVQTHYVAPSFWAWKGGETRLPRLSGYVDHLLCILPFEEEVCRSNGLAATFVGHPTLEDALTLNSGKDPPSEKWKVQGNGQRFRNEHGLSSGATVITLLPGSRLQEVKLMLPTFLNTVKLLKDPFPKVTTVIPVAPNQHVESYIDRTIQTWDIPTILISGRLQDLKFDAFNASRAALTTSGTAIMELQLARLPCVVAYRAHVLTEWLIRYQTKLRYMALPNILLDSAIIPEALFRACTPKNLASFLSQVIHDGHLREQQIVTAEKMFELLSPSERSICDLAAKEVGLPFTDSSPSMIAASTILYSAKRKCQTTRKGPFVSPISPIM